MKTNLNLENGSFDVLYEAMIEQIEDLIQAGGNLIKNYLQCQEVCKQTLQQLKESVLSRPFSSDQEEILFFKNVKPKFYSQLIYFGELHNISLRRPTFNKKAQEEFLNTEYYRIKFTFDTNIELYNYYRNEETYLDEQFYLRNKKMLNKSMDYIYLDEPPVFSTGYDYMVARFMAYEQLSDYLTKAIDQLSTPERNIIPVRNGKSPLIWTGKKTDLAEVVFLLLASKCINHGNIGKGELAEAIFGMFNLQPPNISKMGEELRIRKKGRREFIDSATEDYDKFMDKEDERAY